MQGKPSNWKKLQLPTYMSGNKIYGQAKISDNESLLLYKETENSSESGFVIFDLKSEEFSRVQIERVSSDFDKINEPCFMLFEGNIVIVLKQSSDLTVWKFKISQDKKTISQFSRYAYTGFANIPNNIAVLYKQNIYIQSFELLREESSWADKYSKCGRSETKKIYYRERLLQININTGSLLELKVLGSTPAARCDYFTVLHQHELFLFGGKIQSSEYTSHPPFISAIWALNLDALTWRNISCELSPLPRSEAFACSFRNNIYVFGGRTELSPGSSIVSSELFSYDAVNNSWLKVKETNKSLSTSNGRNGVFVALNGGFLQWDREGFYDSSLLLLKNSDEEAEQNLLGTRAKNLSIKQKNLYEQKPFPDITFKVEQQEIPAHKGVLSAGCRFFENMFTSGMEESSNKVIDVPDIKFDVFEAILQYVYCSTVKVNEEISWDLFEAADKYLLLDLRKICEEFLMNDIKADNVVQVINLAEEYESEALKKAAMKYVADNMDLVFEVADIYKLKKCTLLEICKMKS